MTEITNKTTTLRGAGEIAADDAPAAIDRFILHWGDLGGAWGVNRSVAQIHALLIVSGRPLNAEDVSARLSLARSNVSNSLKELVGWGLVKRVPIMGDRRDHYAADGDAWEMAAKIVAIRKAREIDPAKEVLKSCLDEAARDPATDPAAVRRLEDIAETIALLDGWYVQMKDMPRETATGLLRMGARAVELLRPFLKKKSQTDNPEN